MHLNPNHFDAKLAEFKKVWDLHKIESMTIDDYADHSTKNSLCWWLEYGTKELGQIGGIGHHKFELWIPSDTNKVFRDGRFFFDGRYAWKSSLGNSRGEVFEKVRHLVIGIIEASKNRDLEAVEHIPFHSIGKWKIAFLFSDNQFFPVYSKSALLLIAAGLGRATSVKTDTIATLQKYILNVKPEDEHVVAYAHRLYTEFVEGETRSQRNYWLFGSNYGSTSVIKDFIDNSCVAIGFMDHVDFSDYMGAGEGTVAELVDEEYTDKTPTIGKVKGYFKLLSKIKKGDIVAVKSEGRFGKLTIIAYAKVVEREGTVYWYDAEALGHHIHVEFLETNFSKFTGLTRWAAIHQFSYKDHGEDFTKVFGWYGSALPPDENSEEDHDTDSKTISEYKVKEEDGYKRSAIAEVMVRRIHNKIQNKFIQYLKKNYPQDDCTGEIEFIDAFRESETEMFIYEIKPNESPYWCIRSGIGQLFAYSIKQRTSKRISIFIVGPNKPSDTEIEFIESIRDLVIVPFMYVAFNADELEATYY